MRNRGRREREMAERRGVRAHGVVPRPSTVSIPDDVLIERDRRLSIVPGNTTAALMNDPPAGYSALERAVEQSPSIVSDPLDGLIYARVRAG